MKTFGVVAAAMLMSATVVLAQTTVKTTQGRDGNTYTTETTRSGGSTTWTTTKTR